MIKLANMDTFKKRLICILAVSVLSLHLLLTSSQEWIILKSPQPLKQEIQELHLFTKPIRKPLTIENVTKVMVVTGWRSGSTLMGELLHSYPGSFYTYEPLTFAGIDRVFHGDFKENSTKKIIKGLLNCHFQSVLDEYKKYKMDFSMAAGGSMITQNKVYLNQCKNANVRKQLCSQSKFLDPKCKESHFHITKTVRMGFDIALSLMPETGAKIIYIARDPRALIHSRLEREWCVDVARCIGPKYICYDLERDFYAIQSVKSQLEDRLLVIRYEDFSPDIWNQARSIFKFLLDQDMPKETSDFLKEHTIKSKFKATPKVWNTFRNPNETSFSWKELPFKQILEIQEQCQNAMKLWGYLPVKNQEDLKDFNPLVEYRI